MDIFDMIRIAAARGASDLHLFVSNRPLLRVNGVLRPLAHFQPLTDDDIKTALNQLTSEENRAEFKERLELDFSYTLTDYSRIRCNVAMQCGTVNLTIRLVPLEIPTLEELGLPEVCKELVVKQRGLIIVSGPTGSGKSTTLTAMINYLNGIESRRVITVEDPVEYVYISDKCAITQRELGRDTSSFATALKYSLRQDPDVILVGEMRDTETVTSVLTAAETGHLVLTTSHAATVSQAVERLIDLFPPHERPQIQAQLASLVLGILCQRLVPKADDSGRAPAVEIMLTNPAIRNLIREGKTYQLTNVIRTQAQSGMILLDQALANLYNRGVISGESLYAFCNDENDVEKLTSRVKEATRKVKEAAPA
jgi:twitching motility protein PilT